MQSWDRKCLHINHPIKGLCFNEFKNMSNYIGIKLQKPSALLLLQVSMVNLHHEESLFVN